MQVPHGSDNLEKLKAKFHSHLGKCRLERTQGDPKYLPQAERDVTQRNIRLTQEFPGNIVLSTLQRTLSFYKLEGLKSIEILEYTKATEGYKPTQMD